MSFIIQRIFSPTKHTFYAYASYPRAIFRRICITGFLAGGKIRDFRLHQMFHHATLVVNSYSAAVRETRVSATLHTRRREAKRYPRTSNKLTKVNTSSSEPDNSEGAKTWHTDTPVCKFKRAGEDSWKSIR